MSSSGNDPRQPSSAKPYKPQPVHPDNLPVDYSGFIAIIFGVAGVMFRYKLGSFAVMGMVTNYLSPARAAVKT
ncbi:hypothetical protein Ccrd_023287 [Cynara cardunculus var. scolymus]|uniref:Uncharacterized protein n=1 Tax=Cynara cardunculus var. scolymus TaxID=59895 RepID=A0A118JYE3_CYNCS|nr:hypothetical protein Ccrd_023287 [Cynara cardunculus var. scolymus]